jgi:hypothetical protein
MLSVMRVASPPDLRLGGDTTMRRSPRRETAARDHTVERYAPTDDDERDQHAPQNAPIDVWKNYHWHSLPFRVYE